MIVDTSGSEKLTSRDDVEVKNDKQAQPAKYASGFRRWSRREDGVAWRMYLDGVLPVEIAGRLGRSKRAVVMRLNRLIVRGWRGERRKEGGK